MYRFRQNKFASRNESAVTPGHKLQQKILCCELQNPRTIALKKMGESMILLHPLEAIATIARLTHSVQTLNSQVDTPLEKLTGQLNLALDAIFSHDSQIHGIVQIYMYMCIQNHKKCHLRKIYMCTTKLMY